MTVRKPDIQQAVPAPDPVRTMPLPRNPRTTPLNRNGLPETGGYHYAGPIPMAALLAGETAQDDPELSSARNYAAGYHCPCGATAGVTPGQTVAPAHKPGCPRQAALTRRLLDRGVL